MLSFFPSWNFKDHFSHSIPPPPPPLLKKPPPTPRQSLVEIALTGEDPHGFCLDVVVAVVVDGPELPEVSKSTESCDFISSPPASYLSPCKLLGIADREGDEPSGESHT